MGDPTSQFASMLAQLGPSAAGTPGQASGPAAQALNQIAQQAAPAGSANEAMTAQMVAQLQKLFPNLFVSHVTNGVHHLFGKASDQFLGNVWAKAHGAKISKVANEGRGQRLQVGWH